jgi:NAD(P)-dependent dehydrogenase (short-subunit alcohol dehydrogenase family)
MARIKMPNSQTRGTQPQLPGESIAGLRVIVTGGASGMGAALVRDFASHGANVVSLDLNEAAGLAVVGAAASAAGSVAFVRCDVADVASVTLAFGLAIETLGGLDCLVHAAGIAPGSPAEAITSEAWDQVFAINARGTMLTNQAAFERLKAGGGRIINFASGAALNGYPGKAHYAASKGAVLSWTRSVAKEWGRYGITVNAIAPAISTPMYQETRSLMSADALAAHDARMASDMPIDGKLGDPDRDLAPLMRFLAGAGSRFITGQVFAVDGGLAMVR